MGVAIVTFDDEIFNEIGMEYKEDISVEHNLVDYNPYYIQSSVEIKEIEMNLLLYDPRTMTPLKINETEDIYNWLITDDFASFISDDDPETIYYFKVISITKNFTFNGEGYLTVVFKPYSKYCYRRKRYIKTVNGSTFLEIPNPSRLNYSPIIEITNRGDENTINHIGDMQIKGLSNGEKIIIDNLSKIVQDSNGNNRFSTCNRKWIELKANSFDRIILEGNMSVEFICEFPILL